MATSIAPPQLLSCKIQAQYSALSRPSIPELYVSLSLWTVWAMNWRIWLPHVVSTLPLSRNPMLVKRQLLSASTTCFNRIPLAKPPPAPSPDSANCLARISSSASLFALSIVSFSSWLNGFVSTMSVSAIKKNKYSWNGHDCAKIINFTSRRNSTALERIVVCRCEHLWWEAASNLNRWLNLRKLFDFCFQLLYFCVLLQVARILSFLRC